VKTPKPLRAALLASALSLPLLVGAIRPASAAPIAPDSSSVLDCSLLGPEFVARVDARLVEAGVHTGYVRYCTSGPIEVQMWVKGGYDSPRTAQIMSDLAANHIDPCSRPDHDGTLSLEHTGADWFRQEFASDLASSPSLRVVTKPAHETPGANFQTSAYLARGPYTVQVSFVAPARSFYDAGDGQTVRAAVALANAAAVQLPPA
jgi:hypothetical protein